MRHVYVKVTEGLYIVLTVRTWYIQLYATAYQCVGGIKAFGKDDCVNRRTASTTARTQVGERFR